MIKINDLHLEKMLSLQPEAGKNYLKNMRVLILNAEAIGVLRKDLISSLDTEKAKGLLIRYGFAIGYRDAVNTLQDFSPKGKIDSYQLSVLFHTFVGMARVSPIEMYSNEDENNWCCEGIWHDSYEAEHHVKHFGPATEPVCWTLVGYASGSMSALLGERVIIKEVSCSAKGDPHCRYIGKTLAAWGDEILPELQYYKDINKDKALDQALVRMRAQNDILKQSMAIHKQLNRLVLDGKDMSVIAATLGSMIGGTVIVEDLFFRPVAYFTPTTLVANNFPTHMSCSAKDIFSNPRHRDLSTTLIQEKRQVQLLVETSRNPFSRLISPIVIGQDVLGFVSTIKTFENFTELDRLTLDHAASIFAIKMMQTRAVAEVETRLSGNLVKDLIAGNFNTEMDIIERSNYLGYNISQPHSVMIINLENLTSVIEHLKRDQTKIIRFKERICDAVNKALNNCNRQGIVADDSNNNIIVFISLGANTASSKIIEVAKSIRERFNQQFPQINISIGIGRICHALRDFPLSYQEAQRALKVMKGLNQSNTVISFDSLGTYGLLFHAADQKDLLAFMKEQLGKLLEYDVKYQTELVETLNLYFSYDGNIKKAAIAAAVTPSGFRYRLRKICEVGNFDFKDPNKRFDLQMALKVWCITTKGSNHEPNI